MSTTIEQKRAQLLSKFNSINIEIKKLTDVEEPVYFTLNKYLPKIGYIHEIETLTQIVKAKKYIDKETSSNSAIIAELGLKTEEIETEDVKLMGFSIDKWNADIQTKIVDIRRITRLEKLQKDLSIVSKYLSDDDKFNLAMDELDTVEWDGPEPEPKK